MTEILTSEEKQILLARHRLERDGVVKDRIKVILLRDKGWSYLMIAEALFVSVDTVGNHVKNYTENKKLSPTYPGSQSKLNETQTSELVAHLTENTYATTVSIRAYVKTTYDVEYSQQGMQNWLVTQNFSYKKPKGIPAKADPEKQKLFIEFYESLAKKVDEPLYFIDSVHPTIATKVTYGWLPKGQDSKYIETTGARTRINITGALNLETMDLIHEEYEKIEGKSTVEFLKKLEAAHPEAEKINVILDNGPAHVSEVVKQYSENSKIVLNYLPTYSPNLNPIERVWKVMNETTRNNVFFSSASEFRDALKRFFEIFWPQRKMDFIDRINDNFEVFKPRDNIQLLNLAISA